MPDVEEWWSEQENRLEQWAPGQAEEALSDFCDSVTETIYRACQRARQRVPREDVGENQMAISATSHSRWRKLLSLRDPKAIWQAINWRGEFEFPGNNESPSDSEFVSHFEHLLGPTESREDIDPPIVNMYVPLLDDSIRIDEVAAEVRRLKSHKAAGIDGMDKSHVVKYKV